MIIFRLSGGFGNQLWSFAAGYSLAKETGELFGLDTSTQDAKWFFRDTEIENYAIEGYKKISYRLGDGKLDHLLFNHVCRRSSIGLFTLSVNERNKNAFDPDIFADAGKKRNIYYIGDWQHKGYFKKYEADIRRMYVYKNEISKEGKKLLGEIKMTESIGVHVRRGDYVRIGIALTPEFYIKAFETLADKIKDPVFYCFTEDESWCRKAFEGLPYDIRYTAYEAEHKNLEDFELLRACRHQIISRSTFSWWAAYLNEYEGKITVVPDNPVWNRTDKDTWPDEWIYIDAPLEKRKKK